MQVFIDYLGELNWLAVFVAAFAAFIAGAIWYSQALFGKQWQKEVGLNEKKLKEANMTNVMGVSILTVVVTAVAVGLLVKVLVLTSVAQGILFGIMVAVGLLGMNKLMQSMFEQRSFNYWLITLGADVVSLSVMGAILASWQ